MADGYYIQPLIYIMASQYHLNVKVNECSKQVIPWYISKYHILPSVNHSTDTETSEKSETQ